VHKIRDGVPPDYKFSVFDRKYAMIQADVARFFGHSRTSFTRTWELLLAEFGYPQVRKNRRGRINWTRCLKVAEIGKRIDFVPVDIHDSNHRPNSEMTFFPKAPTGKFSPSRYDYWLGSFWKLNKKA
jgi:hypothetical protein